MEDRSEIDYYKVFINGYIQTGTPTPALLDAARQQSGQAFAFYDPRDCAWKLWDYPGARAICDEIGGEYHRVHVWYSKPYGFTELN